MPISDRICFRCGTLIVDPQYLMIDNQSCHLSCLKCSNCGRLLEEAQRCFAKHGRLLCRNDCVKCSSDACTRCKTLLKPNEIILRAEQWIFHLECFTCVICHRPFHPGDDYGLRDDLIYCPEHFFEPNSSNSKVILDDSGYHTSPNETRQPQINEDDYFILSPTLLHASYYNETDDGTHPNRQKRLRTSFKHNQLRCMRSYFNLNHNPDAKDLKNLSEKTNLSKRVLQVWFQNARAKFRRSHTSSREDKTRHLSSPNNLTESDTCISIS